MASAARENSRIIIQSDWQLSFRWWMAQNYFNSPYICYGFSDFSINPDDKTTGHFSYVAQLDSSGLRLPMEATVQCDGMSCSHYVMPVMINVHCFLINCCMQLLWYIYVLWNCILTEGSDHPHLGIILESTLHHQSSLRDNTYCFRSLFSLRANNYSIHVPHKHELLPLSPIHLMLCLSEGIVDSRAWIRLELLPSLRGTFDRSPTWCMLW